MNTWTTSPAASTAASTPKFACPASASAAATPTCSSPACRSARPSAIWYLGLVPAGRGLAVRPQPAAQPRRPRAADPARQRDGRRRHGRQRPGLQGAGLPRVARCTPAWPACCSPCRSARIAPESFTLELSVLYLAMIVLGGLGSVGGAVAGAAFVSALPVVFQRYADSLPLLSQPGPGRRQRRPGRPHPVRPRDHRSSSCSSRPASPASPAASRRRGPSRRRRARRDLPAHPVRTTAQGSTT